MKKGTKVLLILLIAGVFLLVSSSFPQTELSERALIVGLGIDFDPATSLYEVTIETIVPEGSSEDQSSSGANSQIQKCMTGKGPTVSLAFRTLFNHFGKVPSFGECNIILLGEQCIKTTSLPQTLNFFFLSDAFKDGMLVAACEGDAKSIFYKKSITNDYTSFAMSDLLMVSGKKAQIPYSTLCDILREQKSKSQSCFINYLKFQPIVDPQQSENSSGQQGGAGGQNSQINGKFVAEELAVFSQGVFKGILNKEEVAGLNLCLGEDIFTTFFLGQNDVYSAFGVVSSSGGAKPELNTETITLRAKLKLTVQKIMTDTTGEVLPFQPKTAGKVTDAQKQAIKTLSKEYILAALQKNMDLNCDFLSIKSQLFSSYGKKFEQFENQNKENFWDKLVLVVEVKVEG